MKTQQQLTAELDEANVLAFAFEASLNDRLNERGADPVALHGELARLKDAAELARAAVATAKMKAIPLPVWMGEADTQSVRALEPESVRAEEPESRRAVVVQSDTLPDGSDKVLRLTWDGDLTDDCTCRCGDFVAHVEVLDRDAVDLNGDPVERWWFAVYCDEETIFNSADAGGFISTGALARAMAESLILAHLGAGESVGQ
jgi:hypothetical protein